MVASIQWAEDLARRLASSKAALFALALICLLALTYRAWAPLAVPGYPQGHDGLPPIRVFAIDRCLRDGQIPCRWNQDLAYNYGFPIFNYYPPGASYVSEAIHLVGFSIQDSIKIVFILGFVLSGFLMFLLGREFWGNLGGMIAALFYVYAPYHAVDAYVRTAQAEHWAITFFPGVLWVTYKLLKEGKPAYMLALAFFIAMLLLSHNLLTMIFMPLALAWAIVWLWRFRRLERGALLLLAGVWALALAAFFTLPALYELDLTRADLLKTGYQNSTWFWGNHFVEWDQLFLDRSWGFGGSVPGPADGMSFQIGWVHWGVTLLALPVAAVAWRRDRAAFSAVAFFLVFFWLSVFMNNEASTFVWRAIPWLDWVQFPWRFLSLVILTSSFLAGALIFAARNRPHLAIVLSAVLVGTLILANQGFFRTGEGRLYISDKERFSGYYYDVLLTSGPSVIDYLPVTASEPTAFPLARAEVVRGQAVLSDIDQRSAKLSLVAETRAGATVRASIFDFPNWRVRVNGERVPHNHDNKLGLITFDVPPGRSDVSLDLEDTVIRVVGNYLSLVAWTLFVVAGLALLAVHSLGLWQRMVRKGDGPQARTQTGGTVDEQS